MGTREGPGRVFNSEGKSKKGKIINAHIFIKVFGSMGFFNYQKARVME